MKSPVFQLIFATKPPQQAFLSRPEVSLLPVGVDVQRVEDTLDSEHDHLDPTALKADKLKLSGIEIPLEGEETMADEKKYEETSTSETKTKTSALGTPQKDAAGESIKVTTTKTEGKETKDK